MLNGTLVSALSVFAHIVCREKLQPDLIIQCIFCKQSVTEHINSGSMQKTVTCIHSHSKKTSWILTGKERKGGLLITLSNL